MFCKILTAFACAFLLNCQFSTNATSVESPFYNAGVVEFRPVVTGMSSSDMVREHVRAYVELLNSAEAYATDIVVFPEGTLNNVLQSTYVPAAEQSVVPCLQSDTEYADFLMQLSCAARDVRKYVVINLTEKENCTAATSSQARPCASNGLNVYNTNVVFDREGRVVSRYRKVHVYMEAKNTTLEPELGIFETDFGVRFGHFICFDMLFYTPAQELVEKYGIRDFIFPSWFYSELPFLTAVQLQHAWAWGNNVNLLAAGASFPLAGTTGSGIFAGANGERISLMTAGSGERRMLVAQVPKLDSQSKSASQSAHTVTPRRVTPTELPLMKDPQLANFNSELIDFSQEHNVTRHLCFEEQCCNFKVLTAPQEQKVRVDGSVYYHYRLGVFAGERTYEEEEWSTLKICALYACTNDSVASCGELFPENVPVAADFVFRDIQIEGAFTQAERLLIMPNSLTEQLYPLPAAAVTWQFQRSESGNFHDVHFSLDVEVDNLLTFAIYANYYDKSTASTLHTLTALPLLLALASLLLAPLLSMCK